MAVTNIAIIGAGIAGLTAALSFAGRGVRCNIIEQAAQLSEVGAGLQLSPNATSILKHLGVLADIEDKWTEPTSINLASGIHARNIVELPIAQVARKRWGAPYGVLHRSTLQQALLKAVENHPLCTIHYGQRLNQFDSEMLGSVTGEPTDLIVGADGVWSSVRRSISGLSDAQFSGTVAFRFTIPQAEAPSFFAKGAVTAFLGPGAHLVAYPLREIGGYNLVLLSQGQATTQTWDDQASSELRQSFIRRMQNWHPQLLDLVKAQDNPRCWPLFEVKSSQWTNGTDRILIGDAAHAMTPFAAQGAAMAIEDGYELAAFVAESQNDMGSALIAFTAHRQPRIERARTRAAINRFAYHARGPFSQARDLLLAFRPEKSFLTDFDWLYGYQPRS
jgi:salicylate hydroxylase